MLPSMQCILVLSLLSFFTAYCAISSTTISKVQRGFQDVYKDIIKGCEPRPAGCICGTKRFCRLIECLKTGAPVPVIGKKRRTKEKRCADRMRKLETKAKKRRKFKRKGGKKSGSVTKKV